MSLHSGALNKSRRLASRAAQTLVLFMTPATAAVLLTAPQPGTALGAELLALAAVAGITLFILDRRAGHDLTGAAGYVEQSSPNTITAMLVAARVSDHRHSQRCPGRAGRPAGTGAYQGSPPDCPHICRNASRRSPTCLAMGPCTASSWNANGAGRGGS